MLREISVLYYYTRFYILLDIIVIRTCICILYFYTSCHNFLFNNFFHICPLVRNENIKRPGFYALQVTFFYALQVTEFSTAKTTKQNTRKCFDLLEVWSAVSGDPR